MDYSAHDPDHPAGGDPWASSPQHSRTSFGQPPTNDIPSSPLPPQASPYGQDSDNYGYVGDHNSHGRPNTASENGDPARPQAQDQRQDGQTAQQQQQHHQAQGQQGHQQPQRYHGNRPQKSQTQYKLQAKVTGLERTGKKDPILRFDVYVRNCSGYSHETSVSALDCLLTALRPTSPNFARHNSATSAGCTLNSSS